MKIPETSVNVGAYYGNEENGQWQPNGVIIDSGVGGGVVGSGDAGLHRPPYPPVHAPRHIPAGYVMAGAFYPPPPYAPPPQDDFEDYMWMENEEEFDKQVMQQLEEEALMEQCIEAMLEDEQRERTQAHNGHKHYPTTSNGNPLSLEETVSRSTLNPLAAEFVPTIVRPQTQDKVEEKQQTQQAEVTSTTEASKPEVSTEQSATEEKTDVLEVTNAEAVVESTTPATPVVPVSADDKRPKEPRKEAKKDAKKPAKVEAKPKAKPQPAKSEPKLAAKKPEAKPAASEPGLDNCDAPLPDSAKPQTQPAEEVPSGPKPINYAAAARATKPKKPAPSPAPAAPAPAPAPASASVPKPDKKPTDKADRKDKPKVEKATPKPEKVAQRKNSAK